MRFPLDKLKLHLRACANCGRGIFLRTSSINLYCSLCWSTLFTQTKFSQSPDYPFKVFSLFVWSNFSSQVENLIYSLKGGGLPEAFQSLAEEFVLRTPFCEQPTILVTPPSLRPPDKDHAWAWGKALSNVLGCRLVCPFLWPFEFATSDFKSQKQLSKSERFERQFKLKEGIDYSGVRIVFVDDLITSGATALAAHQALKSPVNFEVWTIARRPKLAGI